MKFEGGESGPNVKAHANLNMTNQDIDKSIDTTTDMMIRPNVDTPESKAMIAELDAVAKGGALNTDLKLKATAFLSKQNDPISAIVVPLRMVKAVHGAYVADPNALGSPAFVRFLNEMSMEVTACTKELKMVETQWELKVSKFEEIRKNNPGI